MPERAIEDGVGQMLGACGQVRIQRNCSQDVLWILVKRVVIIIEILLQIHDICLQINNN